MNIYKACTLSLFFIFCTSAVFAKPLYERLLLKKYYYSALQSFIVETTNKTIKDTHLQDLEKILNFSGVDVLEDFQERILEKYQTPSVFFILARKYFFKKNYTQSSSYAQKIPSDHSLYAESQLLLAQIFSINSFMKQELDSYRKCATTARSRIASAEDRYNRTLAETCVANHARKLFKTSRIKEALHGLNKFPKDTYKWPYLLFERAWLYFHLGDYNRALGLLVTYKAPLLDTYFFPEAEYLAALSYFKLCLWGDSSIIINKYYQFYRPKYLSLEKVLRENKNKKNYFFNLINKNEMALKEHSEFVSQIVTRMRRQNNFSSLLEQISNIDSEIKQIESKESIKVKQKLLPTLNGIYQNLVSKVDNQAKLDIFKFLSTVRKFSEHLFGLGLEIISRKKDLIYENKELVSGRSRGHYKNVKRTRFEYFWKFQGPFWADEIGDYSLGLKSNCNLVERGAKK